PGQDQNCNNKGTNRLFPDLASAGALHRGLRESEKAAKKPVLNKKQIKQRTPFARKYLEWTVGNLVRVIFSDEFKFNKVQTDGQGYHKVDRYDNNNIAVQGMTKFHGSSMK
ncbi:hypothetical protein BGX21_007527, partial [Mortierella sp. AD011]